MPTLRRRSTADLGARRAAMKNLLDVRRELGSSRRFSMKSAKILAAKRKTVPEVYLAAWTRAYRCLGPLVVKCFDDIDKFDDTFQEKDQRKEYPDTNATGWVQFAFDQLMEFAANEIEDEDERATMIVTIREAHAAF